jgi:general secretion pathway protein G
MDRKRSDIRQGGFTLVEIMVVIVILGMLVAIVAPNVLGSAARAEVETAKIEVGKIAETVESFFITNRRMPEGIEELIREDDKGQAWLKGYTEVPIDPWSNPYVLIPGEHRGTFEVISWGPDGVEDTEDDISSKTVKDRRKQ